MIENIKIEAKKDLNLNLQYFFGYANTELQQ